MQFTKNDIDTALNVFEKIYDNTTKVRIIDKTPSESKDVVRNFKRSVTKIIDESVCSKKRKIKIDKIKIDKIKEVSIKQEKTGLRRLRKQRIITAGTYCEKLATYPLLADSSSSSQLTNLDDNVNNTDVNINLNNTQFNPDYTDIKMDNDEPINVETPIKCYICKNRYNTLHKFYDQLCIKCGDFNHAKRTQKIPLNGKIALVTGGRVKIGFQIAVKLLRSGVDKLYVTTRFPNDAAARYAMEADYNTWKDKLVIYGMDFRNLKSVESFIKYILSTIPKLDILINNAALTIWRPPEYYNYLIEREFTSSITYPTVSSFNRINNGSLSGASSAASAQFGIDIPINLSITNGPSRFREKSIVLDVDGLPIDDRKSNTWTQEIEDVNTTEILETVAVNSCVPFMFISKLKPIMEGNKSFIINVSSMEGSFTRIGKISTHPHTNCAKAYLDMITRTSSGHYAKFGIFMNSVDTGWVTNENPQAHLSDFVTPIDEIDGAMRVLDPIAIAVKTGTYHFGKYFKDYEITENGLLNVHISV